MTDQIDRHHRTVLRNIAHRVMGERGFSTVFTARALAEAGAVRGPAARVDPARDLRHLLWCSIDNDDSRDLDQLTVAEPLPEGAAKILVAVADVDAVVGKGSALDDQARRNATSVYTFAATFPMLPEKLSADFTSLNYGQDRLAVVIEMVVAGDGSLRSSGLYGAAVRNRARLSYNGVAGWLDGIAPMPPGIGAVSGLDVNLRLQDRVARKLRSGRHLRGALELETVRARPVFDGEVLTGLIADAGNRARDLIGEFMIAANGVSARYLASHNMPYLRRVVRAPKRWGRIVEIAAKFSVNLPGEPDAKALDLFLLAVKAFYPLRFSDVSQSVKKLLGAGAYVVEIPEKDGGYFGLALKDYVHSTAPNRRYPDLVNQRLLKAAAAGRPPPYKKEELETLAAHCTVREDAAKKVERQVAKSAAAILMAPRTGEQFDAIVTGASAKGTWVRLADPPVEGKLASGFRGLDVGHRVRVKLIRANVESGHIDFKGM